MSRSAARDQHLSGWTATGGLLEVTTHLPPGPPASVLCSGFLSPEAHPTPITMTRRRLAKAGMGAARSPGP
jgi:hypothetical protein